MGFLAFAILRPFLMSVGGRADGEFVRALGLLNAAVSSITGQSIAVQLDDETGEVVGFQIFNPGT